MFCFFLHRRRDSLHPVLLFCHEDSDLYREEQEADQHPGDCVHDRYEEDEHVVVVVLTFFVFFLDLAGSWLLGVFVFAILIGDIKDIVGNARKNSSAFQMQMDAITAYLNKNKVGRTELGIRGSHYRSV